MTDTPDPAEPFGRDQRSMMRSARPNPDDPPPAAPAMPDDPPAHDPPEPANPASPAAPAVPPPASPPATTDTPPGNGIVLASWAGTTAFAITSALAAALPATDIVALLVALAMFLAGTVGFFVAFVRAVARSRTEEIGVMNLFFLDHSAPKAVRRSMLGSLAVEIAVAIGAAALRPNTSLAFGILAPVYALSLQGVWASRHGTFPPRKAKPRPNR